jgi:hypothetical protein
MAAVEGELLRVSRRFAGVLRTTVLVCVTAIAVVRAEPGQIPALAGISAVVVVWSAVFILYRGSWILPVDTALVAALCLVQLWVVPVPDLDNSANWVLAVVSSTAVAYQ